MSYATLAEFKASVGITDSTDDTALQSVLDATDQLINNYCDSKVGFGQTASQARYYTTNNLTFVLTDPIVSVSALQTDDDGDGTYETTLRLYPEELGQVSVRIQVNGGTVSIHAYGASDIAVQALREAMPDLRQDLLQSGLDLVDSQVDQGSSFLGNEQEPSSAQVVDSRNSDRPVNQRNGEVAEPDIDALTNIGLTQGGRVDVRV